MKGKLTPKLSSPCYASSPTQRVNNSLRTNCQKTLVHNEGCLQPFNQTLFLPWVAFDLLPRGKLLEMKIFTLRTADAPMSCLRVGDGIPYLLHDGFGVIGLGTFRMFTLSKLNRGVTRSTM